MVATAVDAAGNTATASATYTGDLNPENQRLLRPVTPDVLNVAKGGSTVPLKFTVYDGSTAITDPTDLTPSVLQTACPGTTIGRVMLGLLFGSLALAVGAYTGRRANALAVADTVAAGGYVLRGVSENLTWLRGWR